MSSKNHWNKTNNRIDEELVSIDSLKHVLFTRCSCKDVDIHREQYDPPDFTVAIDGKQYPTEVTSIVSEQDQQYRAHCNELAKAIRDRAENLGIISGKYALSIFRSPNIPKPTSQEGRQLINDAINHIEATRQQAQSIKKVTLAKDKLGEIRIWKYKSIGSTVDVPIRVTSKWGIEIENELVKLIQDRINIKTRRLQEEEINPRKAILVFYDAYNYVKPIDVNVALQKVKGYEQFHSIFWADSFAPRNNTTYPKEPGRDGFFLFSTNEEWHKVGTIQIESGT